MITVEDNLGHEHNWCNNNHNILNKEREEITLQVNMQNNMPRQFGRGSD